MGQPLGGVGSAPALMALDANAVVMELALQALSWSRAPYNARPTRTTPAAGTPQPTISRLSAKRVGECRAPHQQLVGDRDRHSAALFHRPGEQRPGMPGCRELGHEPVGHRGADV